MTLAKSERLALIRETGVIAVMRATDAGGLLAAADALLQGGVRVLEVTMTTAGALDVITAARRRYGDEILFGAGSVLDGETALATIRAGAQFIVAPTLKLDTIVMGQRYGVPVIPGCYTPTECLTAWEHGAAMIKLFPATVGGPAYIRALLAPLPQLEIVPVGGVTLENASAFMRAGATAVGVGSYLVNQQLLDAGDVSVIQERAAGLVAAIKKGRSPAP
jgi:2-dehydro-3-deoxyphosphogluconate aldolase/(4S)-4-hydroxy-2-oxoglutarate aldolase